MNVNKIHTRRQTIKWTENKNNAKKNIDVVREVGKAM